MKEDGSKSKRRMGDWASFVHPDRDIAIKMAREAQLEWEASGFFGPYRMLIGTLTGSVVFPPVYDVVDRLSNDYIQSMR